MPLVRVLLTATCVLLLAIAAPAGANTSHDGWPQINGMLLMNKTDSNRPLDARPGHDPFHGTDPRYSCDAVHKRGRCHALMAACDRANANLGHCTLGGRMTGRRKVHNELLGGHGSDTIYAGPIGDVLWGDYKWRRRLHQGALRPRNHRLWPRSRRALHLAQGAAAFRDPPLREDLAHDAGVLTGVSQAGWLSGALAADGPA